MSRITYDRLPEGAKPWKDGLLYVTEEGAFYRLDKKRRRYIKCTLHRNVVKGTELLTLLCKNESGQWRAVSAHVIYAEVFIKKPIGAKIVKAKDNDRTNLSRDNLYWYVSRNHARGKSKN